MIFEVADDRNNFRFTLNKSYQLRDTYDTQEILETFAGDKPIAINQKTLVRKQLELFNDPLQDFKEDCKSGSANTTFSVRGVEIKSIDQFKDLSKETQDFMRKENNPLELDKAVHYPIK